MAIFLNLDLAHKNKSTLYIYENILPQPIKRIFFIKGIEKNEHRGAGPIDAYEGIVCIEGSCKVIVKDNITDEVKEYNLNSPQKCLILEPKEWHQITNFLENTIIMAFSDKSYEECKA
jgi:hypothetical protein